MKDIFDQIQDYFGETKMRPDQYSALSLAYIGDAIYDLIIRTIVIDQGGGKVKDFHRETSNIVKASAQALLVKQIIDTLSEEELAVYKRGRNAKSATSAKNASITDYRVATGLEALIGHLYLSHQMERAIQLVKEGLEKTGQLQKIMK